MIFRALLNDYEVRFGKISAPQPIFEMVKKAFLGSFRESWSKNAYSARASPKLACLWRNNLIDRQRTFLPFWNIFERKIDFYELKRKPKRESFCCLGVYTL